MANIALIKEDKFVIAADGANLRQKLIENKTNKDTTANNTTENDTAGNNTSANDTTAKDMTEKQKKLLMRLIKSYINKLRFPLAKEDLAKIEKAGMSVVAETVAENNEEIIIWKLQRSEKERMAVSRSFGDFEYKSNPNLLIQEQAVVSTNWG